MQCVILLRRAIVRRSLETHLTPMTDVAFTRLFLKIDHGSIRCMFANNKHIHGCCQCVNLNGSIADDVIILLLCTCVYACIIQSTEVLIAGM